MEVVIAALLSHHEPAPDSTLFDASAFIAWTDSKKNASSDHPPKTDSAYTPLPDEPIISPLPFEAASPIANLTRQWKRTSLLQRSASQTEALTLTPPRDRTTPPLQPV